MTESQFFHENDASSWGMVAKIDIMLRGAWESGDSARVAAHYAFLAHPELRDTEERVNEEER